MARIRHLETQKVHHLMHFTTVGREGNLPISLSDTRISRLHLEINWDEEHWSLLPRGSGPTYLNGRQITAAVILEPGHRVALATTEPLLEMLDCAPPVLFARHLDTGEEIEADGEDCLHLPEGKIWYSPEDGWVRDTGSGPRATPLEVGRWVIYWPGRRTGPTERMQRSLSEARLIFYVDRHENVRLEVRFPAETLELPTREEFHLLYLLARERQLTDKPVPVERLMLASALTREKLDVYLGRARQLFSRRGVLDLELLYEAPRGYRRLGLPAESIEIRRLP
jgi:hypothetical protein